jgi:hypothetical protein
LRRLLVAAGIGTVLIGVWLVCAAIAELTGYWITTMILMGFSAVTVIGAWVTTITPELQVERPILLAEPRQAGGVLAFNAQDQELRVCNGKPPSMVDEFWLPRCFRPRNGPSRADRTPPTTMSKKTSPAKRFPEPLSLSMVSMTMHSSTESIRARCRNPRARSTTQA